MLTLEIRVTSEAIASLKSSLRNSLPDIKSSHRMEAAARGLGFRTHASLLAKIKSQKVIQAPVHGDAFSSYLEEKNFTLAQSHLFIATARVAILDAMKKEYRLCSWGIGNGQPERKDDGKRQSTIEHQTEFLALREQLTRDNCVEEFLRALALVQKIPRTKTIRRGSGSYRLKHVAENYICRYPDGTKLGPNYVSNGALIAAAIHAGFKLKKFEDERGWEEPNTLFNMSKPTIDDLDAEFRPDGAVAQQRREAQRNRSSQLIW